MDRRSQNHFVRTSDAPMLSPPYTEVGIRGWIYHNILESCLDFSSFGNGVKSLLMAFLTILIGWMGLWMVVSVIDFAFIQAVWSDPDAIKRKACWTSEQGGNLPADWYGACWPFINAKLKLIFYGAYDNDQLWRVNLTGLIGLVGIVWVMIERLPFRSYVGMFLLTVYPVLALILLEGGGFKANPSALAFLTIVGLALITVGRLSARGFMGEPMRAFASPFDIGGWILVIYVVVMALLSVDYGLKEVGTHRWGGLMITLVVAVTGIVASLPLGVVLALGRRSSLPVVRLFSIGFIEFWRGVPLITVLFVASAMLPLFLPEGVNFNNLLRALIGVMLFSAAYMAEVVRGGLQAIDAGQYEGADALGLSYVQKMRLIILPQALTHVIPGIVNTFIGLFKDTTLVSIIGLADLLGVMQRSFQDASWASPVQANTGYIIVGALFFIFCFGMSRYSIYMEKKLNRDHRH